jgi:hypothetical protein
MIRSTVGTAFVVSIVAVAAACSTTEAAPDKYPSVDSFCAAKAKAECDAVAAACTVSSDTCTSARKNACATAAGVATGQGRTYRAANAQTCIDKATVLYADRVLDPTKEEAFYDACERVFSGSKKKSDPCSNAYDCEGSLVCDVDKGFCADKVTKKLKDPCNNPGDICDTGLFCQDQGGSKFCAAKGALGAACRIPEVPCVEDLRCNGTSCVALEAASQPCDTNDECVTHFCNATKLCQAAQYASETGTCKDFGGN